MPLRAFTEVDALRGLRERGPAVERLDDLTGPRLRPYQSHLRSRSRRALVDQYTKYAEQLGFDYPRSKNMLKRIADSWASHARMADMESELREDLSD